MKVACGVDVGSISTEVVLIGPDRTILSYNIDYTGASGSKSADRCLKEALAAATEKVDNPEVAFCVSTGYGRDRVTFADKAVTEITCHAKGAHYFFPDVRTIIDIGGQDSKAIRIDDSGRVLNFVMNDKCAAGTGRFLEVMARALELELEEMGDCVAKAKTALPVSSMCTVFAESEVVSLLAKGNAREDVCAGLHEAVAKRVIGLVRRVGKEERVCFSGGVAKNKGMKLALEKLLETEILVAEEPQIMGALGAALIAFDQMS